MCTAITLQFGETENFFGRTMDFSYDIEPKLYVVPKNYAWQNALTGCKFHNTYSFIGIGQEKEDMLAFFDGVNEQGFAAAALYFAGFAKYSEQADLKRDAVSSLDFLHYILGKCGSLKDLNRALDNVSIIGVPDPVTQAVAPLHWIATDRTGESVVIEQTEDGLRLFKNPVGILANSPDFQWHMTNLRNYMNASPIQTKETSWGNVKLKPFGQAGGTLPLPGGYTSPERFVKTAYQKTHIQPPKNQIEGVNACFHIMEGVSVPKGVIMTDRNTSDYTKYTAFVNTNTCQYFFKTYDNPQIGTATLRDNDRLLKQPHCIGELKRPVVFQEIK